MHKKESSRSRIVVLHHVLLCFSLSVTEPFTIAKVFDRNKVAMLRGMKTNHRGTRQFSLVNISSEGLNRLKYLILVKLKLKT